VSTLKEPYRVEGKKTMAFELAEQLEWRYPDWIIYPTGGGTGMVGMWKAFEEMEAIGWIAPQRRPRMVSVQAEGCAPIVRAFDQGLEKAPMWENATTHAHGLRVPKAIGDFLMLRALRESHGAGIAVSEAEIIQGVKDASAAEGLFVAPEGGACVAALRKLKASGHLSPDDTVVTSKMLYASHYFWTGLELRVLLPDPSRGDGFWFATVNRSRSDGLSGFTGQFVRRRARSEVQDGTLAALRTTKQMLERSR